MWVLIVEDDDSLATALKEGLEELDHSVTLARDGAEGWTAVSMHDFDVMVLDIMLPTMDGFELIRRLRRAHNPVPILVLTARDSVDDIVNGLDLGANDYMTKPFAFQELVARLRSVARSRAAEPDGCLKVGDLVLNPISHLARRGEKRIVLSPTQYRLLEFLMRRAGRAVSRSAITEAIWGFDRDVDSNTLDVFVRLLRSKIDVGTSAKLIHTVRGFGYCVREPDQPDQ